MRKLIASVVALLFAGSLLAAGPGQKKVHVKGYTKKDGTKVEAYDRTAPNKTKNDNWSTKGNVNPETGKEGTKPKDGEVTSPETKHTTATAHRKTTTHHKTTGKEKKSR